MGVGSSKAAKTASNTARRKYPLRPSPSTNETQQTPQPSTQQENLGDQSHRPFRGERPSESRTEAIDLDARDPQLSNALKQIGPVQPNPTFSPSSSAFSSDPTAHPSSPSTPNPRNNPALAIMAARKRIEEEIEADKAATGKPGFAGRRHIDITTIRKALMLRDEQGVAPAEVERILGLKNGTVSALGGVGIVEAA